MSETSTADDLAIDVYLAEYNSLRGEQLGRLQYQNQAFHYLLLIMGAGITAVVTSIVNKPDVLPLVILGVALCLPILTAPLCFIFFDNEMVIHAIGSYLHHDLRPRLVRLVGDERLFASIWDFKYLHASSKGTQQALSVGRWLLFLVPTVLILLGGVVHATASSQWWISFLGQRSHVQAGCFLVLSITALLIDIAVCSLLGRAIIWSMQKHEPILSGADWSEFPIR